MRDMLWVSGDGGRGVGRLVNEVERVGEGEGGYVDQFCRRIDL